MLWANVEKDKKDNSDKINVVYERLDNVEFCGTDYFEKIRLLEQDNQKLKDNLTYLQSQSMRNNLIFGNIADDQNERPDCTEGKIRLFLIEKLQMAKDVVDNMQLERVHRMGAPNSRYTRNVVCKFTYFKERE